MPPSEVTETTGPDATQQTASSSGEQPSAPRLLLVEDDRVLAPLLLEVLAENHEVDHAPDGQAGLHLALTRSYQLMVVDEILRGRYRKSFEKPEAVKPGEVTEYKWSLHGADHTFLKGHKIMVQVQSSWFPLYDRNPQTYVPNIMTAPSNAYKAETISIYESPKYPSHLEFVMPE